MEEKYKRAPAIRLHIADILQAKYTKGETPLTPHTLTLQNGTTASRISIAGTIINNTLNTENPSVTIDDGTGIITLKTFEQPPNPEQLTPGTLVQAIGKPRQYANTTYITLEIIKKIDQKWLHLWNQQPKPTNLLDTIRKHDNGNGADIDTIIKETNNKDTENQIADLLLKGEIFEISPGKIKVLE